MLNKGMQGFRQYLTEATDFYATTWNPDDLRIIHLYQNQSSISDIKQEMGISDGEIYRALRRHGVNPNRRTSPYHDDVLYYGQCGMPFGEIANMTGYSTRQIRNILDKGQQFEG